MARHNETGKKGEEIALNFLSENGYKILESNWRFGRAEIDIIAKKDDILIFVEVKTRSGVSFGMPEDFVSEKKESLIMDAANEYMKLIGHDWEIRFDIIGILVLKGKSPAIRHIEDAFFPDLNA